MATWQQWVGDKVKDSLHSRPSNDYMNLVPKRNPNDPADLAIKAGAASAGRAYMAGTLMEPGAPPPASAVPELRTNFAAPQAIDPNRPTMEQSIGAARKSLGIPMPEAMSLDEAMARIAAIPNAPKPEPGAGLVRQEGDRVANGRIYSGEMPAPGPTAIPQPGAEPPPMTGIRGGNLPTRWDMARALSQNGVGVPTMSREEMVAALKQTPGVGGLANVATIPDRQLRDLMDQRGLSYFKMTEDQMRKASAPYIGMGTRVAPGGTSFAVPPEKGQAYEARLKQLTDQGMKSDQALNQAALELGLSPETAPGAPRPTAQAFTMGDNGGAVPGGGGEAGGWGPPTTHKQALNMALTALGAYFKNPSAYGKHFPENLLHAIQQLPLSEAVPEAAASEAEYKRAQGRYADAHAGLVPSQIEENLARARNVNKATKGAGVTLPPGTQHFVPGAQTGDPWTKVAEGAEAKPPTTGMPEKMSEIDKTNLAHAWNAYQVEMDPAAKRKLESIIEGINSKYAPTRPAGLKPPVPGARLAKHPTTGAPVWVGPDNKVIPMPGEEEAVPTGEKPAKGKKTLWEHLNAPSPGLSLLGAVTGQ